jgi:hypothetical protein
MGQKLSKNSPTEAHFHRAMREHHKAEMRYYKGAAKFSPEHQMWTLHRKYVEMHNHQYKLAML